MPPANGKKVCPEPLIETTTPYTTHMNTYTNNNGEILGLYTEINTYETYCRLTGDNSFTRAAFNMIVDDIIPELGMSIEACDLRFCFTEYSSIEDVASDYLAADEVERIKAECKEDVEGWEGDEDDLEKAIHEALVEAVQDVVTLYYDEDNGVYLVSE